ncbi:hypothetical protein L484_011388 [Morus notabilis]|uniref:Uncharacterized protein n=1 Tax=Morus notabilis TaxID=981085 RepID=W9R7T2_9ROSA|nr:hypothetical protein L484_011388 [Morus notabilis]
MSSSSEDAIKAAEVMQNTTSWEKKRSQLKKGAVLVSPRDHPSYEHRQDLQTFLHMSGCKAPQTEIFHRKIVPARGRHCNMKKK